MKHNRASIDYYAPWVRQNLEKPEEWARDIVSQSFVVDRTLFFKTHAHSMFPYYREAKRVPVYPHAHPGIQTLFSLVFDAAAAAGIEIEFATASEVYRRFVTAAYVPAEGYALTLAEAAPARKSRQDGRARADAELALEQALPATDLVLEGSGRAVIPSAPEPRSSDFVGPVPATPQARVPPPATPAATAGVGTLAIEEATRMIGRLAPAAITPREVKIAQFVMGLPPFEAYHEVGLEFSMLPLLLGLVGREASGIAIAQQQPPALRGAFDILRREQPGLALRCELVAGRFPDVVMARDVGRSLAIVADLVTNPTPETLPAIVGGFARFAAVLFNADRFLERCQTEVQRQALFARLEAAGMKKPMAVFDLGAGGRYYLMTAKRDERQ
jgi:hypothetical protein